MCGTKDAIHSETCPLYETGINGVLENGEVVASFQYNNTGNKTLTANVLEVVNAGTYEGLLTFVVQYSEN